MIKLLPHPTRLRHGYTLIEVIVALTIIGILAAFALTGLRGASDQESTRNVALEIKSDMRGSQESALSSTLNSAGQPASYYGVLITTNSYQLIRVERGGTLSSPTVIQSSKTPSGVTIASNPGGLKFVTFSENKADVQLYDGNGAILSPGSDGAVTITATGRGGSYSVKIFPATGRIE